MIKYIVAGIIIYLAYIFLFRDKKISGENSADKTDSQTMVECNKCSVFISSDEAVIREGKYYCSRECMGA